MHQITYEELLVEWKREEAEFMAKYADRKAEDYHTQCCDCGAFVKKWRWVKKDSQSAIQRRQLPLCGSCWAEYE